MKKQQVKALLEILKNGREPLEYLQTDAWNDKTVLVATDSYTLVALYVDSLELKPGFGISHATLERWYKLASGRDTLNPEELEQTENIRYPHWQEFVLNYQDAENKKTEMIGFDAKLANRLQVIAGEPLYYELSTDNGAMIAENKHGLFVLMPLKPEKRHK